MSWHPLMVAVAALDALALLFSLVAAKTYIRVLMGWTPQSAEAQQINLEAAADGASVACRYAVGFFFSATLLWVVGISLVLPNLVAGAMCGTGVMTSMGASGQRALILRGVALALLWLWRTLDGLNRAASRPPAMPTVARFQLLAVPLLALAMVDTFRGLWALDPQRPVDCCQAVYASFGSLRQATTTAGLSDSVWLALAGVSGGLALLLSLIALWRREGPSQTTGRLHGALFVVAVVFLPVATVALVRVLSAYHYEVLHHHCPWCLLLPAHHAVGYPLYGALLVVGLEAIAGLAAARFAGAHGPALQGQGRSALLTATARRRRRALWAVVIGLIVFAALTVIPALAWRLQHGVWMHG